MSPLFYDEKSSLTAWGRKNILPLDVLLKKTEETPIAKN